MFFMWLMCMRKCVCVGVWLHVSVIIFSVSRETLETKESSIPEWTDKHLGNRVIQPLSITILMCANLFQLSTLRVSRGYKGRSLCN